MEERPNLNLVPNLGYHFTWWFFWKNRRPLKIDPMFESCLGSTGHGGRLRVWSGRGHKNVGGEDSEEEGTEDRGGWHEEQFGVFHIHLMLQSFH